MFKIILSLLLSIVSISLFGQIKITGYVKSESNETIPYATIVIKNAIDSSFVKAEAATANGSFSLAFVKPGKYFLQMSSVGYVKTDSPVFIAENTNIDFAPIVLKADNQLATVTITANKPLVEVAADKTIFNVGSSINTIGTNGLELLRKAPGVILDNNENVMLEGKTGIRIFIDGKPSVLTGADLNDFLKTLQASDIETIEIITQPSSRFDASGNAGIINIKLKKDRRFGTNGTATLGAGYGQNGKGNASLSLNNRNKNANYFGTLGLRGGTNFNDLNLKRLQNGFEFDNNTRGLNTNKSGNIRAGVDYFLNKKSTLGFVINSNLGDFDGKSKAVTPIRDLSGKVPEQRLISNSFAQNNTTNHTFNTNYRWVDTLSHELTIDVDFGMYNGDRFSQQPNVYTNANNQIIFERNFEMNTATDVNIFTSNIDYNTKLWKGTMGFGAKYSKVGTNNNFLFFDLNKINGENKAQLNTQRSNNFEYDEQIVAGYFNYANKIKKLNYQVGLRTETTNYTGVLRPYTAISSSAKPVNEMIERIYTNAFPSAGLSYSKNPNHAWAINYSARIERPNYQSLNPFEYQIDELSFRKGNPFLQPQFTNSIKVSHTFKYKFTTALSYSKVNGFFTQVTDTLGTNRNFIQEQNIADQSVWNLNVSAPFTVKKWWNVYLNVNAFRNQWVSDNNKFNPLTVSSVNVFGQNTFNLPEKWNLEVSGWWSSPSVWGGTFKTRALGSLDLAIQKRILKEKVSFKAAFSDIFFTSPWYGVSRFGDLVINGNGAYESRVFRITLSHNFGNNQVKATRQRKTSSEDINNRLGGN